MTAILAAPAGLAREQPLCQEDSTRAVKRNCAAMLGLSLAEFRIIVAPDQAPLSRNGRLGGLNSCSGVWR